MLRQHPSRRLPTVLAYTAMIAAAAGIYEWIRRRGAPLVAPLSPTEPLAAAAHGVDVLPTVLLALAVVTVVARALGRLFEKHLRQPPVIGEIVAGILLGPSLLGAIAPDAYAFLMPAAVAPYLGIIANVGVVLFMFLVGLELDGSLLKGSTHRTVAISHASIIAPFLLGAGLALWLYPRYATSAVSFTVFSLFVGVSMSVTAFPVLARILTDRSVQRTRLGVTALSCAAADDVTAWTMVAIIVGVANAAVGSALWTLPILGVFVLGMIFGVRPLLRWLAARENAKTGPLSHGTLAVVFVGLLLSAWMTERIGVHALFGAFLLGAVMPHDGRLAEQIRLRVEDLVVVLLLPAFFAFTGMRTSIGLLDGAEAWLFCALIILVATAGKFGGTLLAARLTGMGWRPSAALGVLMNTRGLMELIVLNIGLDLGVLSPTLFAMFVLMALVTTFATGPLLSMILGAKGFVDEAAPAGLRQQT